MEEKKYCGITRNILVPAHRFSRQRNEREPVCLSRCRSYTRGDREARVGEARNVELAHGLCVGPGEDNVGGRQ